MSCICENIEMGSYKRQTSMKAPYSDKWLCIDTCLVQEIAELRYKGIRTTGCCCGHNLVDGFIGVVDDDIEKMKKLGYKILYNPNRPLDEDSFKPKSINK